jgi:hypothetical protein
MCPDVAARYRFAFRLGPIDRSRRLYQVCWHRLSEAPGGHVGGIHNGGTLAGAAVGRSRGGGARPAGTTAGTNLGSVPTMAFDLNSRQLGRRRWDTPRLPPPPDRDRWARPPGPLRRPPVWLAWARLRARSLSPWYAGAGGPLLRRRLLLPGTATRAPVVGRPHARRRRPSAPRCETSMSFVGAVRHSPQRVDTRGQDDERRHR